MSEFIATSPDGKKFKVTAPEGASEEDMAAFAQQQMAQQSFKDTVASIPGEVIKKVSSAGTGILRGLSNLAGMIPDVSNMVMGAVSQGTSTPMPRMPGGSEEIKALIQKLVGRTPYQPQTQMEKYIARGAQGATAMVPMTGPQALVGATAGLAGEAAANHPAGTDHPDAARLAAELGVLIPSAFFGMKTPPKVRAMESFVGEVGIPNLRKGAANQAALSETLGGPVALTQAMPTKEMSGIVQALLNSPHGSKLRNVMRDELPLAERLMGSMYQNLPEMAADEILKVGSAALKVPKDAREKITKPLYAEANKPVDIMGLADAIDAARLAKNIPLETPKPAARRLLDDMVADPLTELTGRPALQLDNVARKARDAAEKARKSGDSIKMQDNYIIKNTIDDATGEASKALVAAKAEHARLSDELVAPVKNALGKMFPEAMRESKVGDWARFRREFDAADAEKVTKMADYLSEVDPAGKAFQAIFRDSLKTKAEAATQLVDGRMPENAFNAYANAIAGTPTKRAALEAKVAAIAKQQGRDPDEAVKGANAAVDTLFAVSRDRVATSPGSEALKAASQDWMTNLLQYTGIMYPAHGLGRIRARAMAEQLAVELSDAFTSPKGVEKLIDIARFSGMTHKIKNVARGLSEIENQYDDKPKLNVYGQE